MTYPRYTHQQLRCKSLAQLKDIYSEIGCTLEVIDRRCKDSWRSAIARYQASKLQKIDEQDIAQGELNQYIAEQATAIAAEELRAVEISFYHHEYHTGDKLVAAIDYDDDLTQPWVVMVAGVEKFRANTWARCDRFIEWHHKDRTLNEELSTLPTQATQPALPPQEQLEPEEPCTTGNEIMVQIATECDKYRLELLDDGIYTSNGEKLGEVGFTDGLWYFKRESYAPQKPTFCDSVEDAVWLLQISDELPSTNEYLQYHPLEQLSSAELRRLFDAAELVAV